MKKDFESWGKLKKCIQEDHNLPSFLVREIWWCSIGVNVGHEQDGKGREYNRPVLIIKKFNKRLFWGVPLTRQIKDSPHYYKFNFKEEPRCAMLTQLRLWDAKRIMRKMGRLSQDEHKAICQEIKNYLP